MNKNNTFSSSVRWAFGKTLLRIGLASGEKLIAIDGKFKYILV